MYYEIINGKTGSARTSLTPLLLALLRVYLSLPPIISSSVYHYLHFTITSFSLGCAVCVWCVC